MSSILSPLLRFFATSDAHFARPTIAADRLAATTSYRPEAIAGRALVESIAQVGQSDLDMLNYALTLEHFEDVVYRALIARTLLPGKALTSAQTYCAQEHTHVVALTDTITTLGGTPVAQKLAYNLPVVKTEADVIGLTAMVEDVGIIVPETTIRIIGCHRVDSNGRGCGASVYFGAAPLIQHIDLLTGSKSTRLKPNMRPHGGFCLAKIRCRLHSLHHVQAQRFWQL